MLKFAGAWHDFFFWIGRQSSSKGTHIIWKGFWYIYWRKKWRKKNNCHRKVWRSQVGGRSSPRKGLRLGQLISVMCPIKRNLGIRPCSLLPTRKTWKEVCEIFHFISRSAFSQIFSSCFNQFAVENFKRYLRIYAEHWRGILDSFATNFLQFSLITSENQILCFLFAFAKVSEGWFRILQPIYDPQWQNNAVKGHFNGCTRLLLLLEV